MPQQIDVPGMGIVEFPDGMSDDQIATAIRNNASAQSQPAFNPDTGARRVYIDGQPQQSAYDPKAEADAIEAARGTGSFADASSSIIKGIPFGDEILSAAGSPIRAGVDWWKGRGFDLGRAYNEGQSLEAELQRRRDERSPIASTVGAVAGGLAPAAKAAQAGFSLLNNAAPTLGSLLSRGAAEGALWGGLYGAGEGSGLEDRAKNAATGLASGAALGGAFGALGRPGAVKTAKAPSLDALRASKNAAYDATDALGVAYKPQTYQKLVLDVLQDVQGKGFNPDRHPNAGNLILDMVDKAKMGFSPTLRQLDEQIQIIKRDIGVDRGEKFFGDMITKRINGLIDNAKPGQAMTGDPLKAGPAVKEARELNRRYRNAETLQEAFTKAERRAASSNSGGNLENTTRQNVRRVLDNKKTAQFLNDSEKAALENIVRGTKMQNTTRALGNWSKGFGGHALAGGAAAGAFLTGNPLPLALAAVPYLAGSGLKAASRGIGNANRNVAESIIRTGQAPARQISQQRKAAIGLLTDLAAQRLPEYINR